MKNIILLLALAIATPVAAADMMSVSAEQANIRSGPGGDFEVVWAVGRYYPLEVLDREGNWVRVGDYENEEGWIYKSLLSKAPAVVIVTRKANIRSGPGMEHAVAWVADKECSLKVLDMRGEWYQVSAGEEPLGWLHKDVTWGFSGNSELEASGAEL